MLHQIEVERIADCTLIALNDPPTRNSLSLPMVESLVTAFEQAAAHSRAIILTGRGDSFCAGAGLGAGIDPAQADYDAGYPLETHFNRLMLLVRDIPVPLITALPGAVAGGGIGLALLGDMILASETCFFVAGFSRIGLVPDTGAMQLMANAIGKPRMQEFMLLNERLTATKALEWGLINRVVSHRDLLTSAVEIAEKLASGPTIALGLTRRLGWAVGEMSYEQVLTLERDMQRTAGSTADHRDGMAAFAAKRPPLFKGE